MKTTLKLFLFALVIIIGSCKPRPLETSVPTTHIDTYSEKPSQVLITFARDPIRYTNQYTYNDKGLLTKCETNIDTGGNSEREILMVSEYRYNTDNTLSKKDSRIFKNSYLKFQDQDYIPNNITYTYKNKVLTKIEKEQLTIQYFYANGTFDYILIDSSSSTKDSVEVNYTSNTAIQTYSFRTFKGKGLNVNGDTSFHGYRTISTLQSYSYDKDNNKFLAPQSGLTYQFSTLPIIFQKEVLNTFQEYLLNLNDNITIPLVNQLMPNFHTIQISQWWVHYRYDYITDNKSRVVDITEWVPGPTDGLTLSRLINIKY